LHFRYNKTSLDYDLQLEDSTDIPLDGVLQNLLEIGYSSATLRQHSTSFLNSTKKSQIWITIANKFLLFQVDYMENQMLTVENLIVG
jgi:hypothetical protein